MGVTMTAAVVRFALRRVASILIVRERGGDGWIVLAGSHGCYGDRRSALADAHWLAWNLGLAVREVVA
jgi:hypothetical protein